MSTLVAIVIISPILMDPYPLTSHFSIITTLRISIHLGCIEECLLYLETHTKNNNTKTVSTNNSKKHTFFQILGDGPSRSRQGFVTPVMKWYMLQLDVCYYLCLQAFVVVDRFYIALFSALQQTHCALVVCNSE